MHRFPAAGAALAELVLSLTLLAALALVSAPLAARSALLLHQGRVLLEGTRTAESAAAIVRRSAAGGCASASGVDTANLAIVEWNSVPMSGALMFLAVIRDRAARTPPESLATIVPCLP